MSETEEGASRGGEAARPGPLVLLGELLENYSAANEDSAK